RDFNPYKDTRLTTYAVYWIRSYIQDFLLRNWSLVRIGTTAAQKKLFYRLKKEQEKFEREGLSPQPKAIAMNLGVDEDDVKLMQERLSGGDVSMSTPVGGADDQDPITLTQRMRDESPLASNQLEENEQAVLFRHALDEFVLELDERERAIFHERLMSESPRTLQEIGEAYGVTKERARQIEERIKKKLKDFLATHYPDISVR
ncbi:MAG: sigma-70 family RNA polymerase sigma factor, partial [Bdellovibrionales bacterium]|nr:sigma-70 family RNA polymerase sigma factor [Bdellovibrionales bacterium]